MNGALVIGAGPAGLMAADELASAGQPVTLVDAKPSFGRKFLMAGKSGLNLTKDEEFGPMMRHYGAASDQLAPMIAEFESAAIKSWAEGLGQDLFTGSTGRVFPKVMKASPLLRAWLTRLQGLGVELKTRWRWTGVERSTFQFETPEGAVEQTFDKAVLALGGASWARLGSDGAWAPILAGLDVSLVPFAPANVGLRADWSDHMAKHFGAPVKGVEWRAGAIVSRGEAVITSSGLEGGGIYPLIPALRNGADVRVDLLPDQTEAQVAEKLSRLAAKKTLTNRLRSGLGLDPAKIAMLMEFGRPLPTLAQLPKLIKALPLGSFKIGDLDSAISTAGGVSWDAVDETLMLRNQPGLFVAGEMLDWEAPTGGYLITACLATGKWAGRHAAGFSPT